MDFSQTTKLSRNLLAIISRSDELSGLKNPLNVSMQPGQPLADGWRKFPVSTKVYVVSESANKSMRVVASATDSNHSSLREEEAGIHYLGQFIPLHYHHNMLMDENRMGAFKAAIDYAVFDGAKVLELGGGTGVLSCLAASRASKVWCVEFNPDLVTESRRLLALNRDGCKVEVIHADAFDYLPPEPVDIVICEMIHAAMLREKQVEMIEAFKQRYQRHFGGQHPVFIPGAVIMAVQPLQQVYEFFGFYAPIIQFQRPNVIQAGTTELAAPVVYSILDMLQPNSREIHWEGVFTVELDGTVNALRFITKNILAIVPEQAATIDWLIDYLVLPLNEPVEVRTGDMLRVTFRYMAGGSIRSLEKGMRVILLERAARAKQ